MAKLIKKDKCKFEAGIIVKKNKQIGIPYEVWCQLNKLELIVQQYMYLHGQPEYQAGPSLEGFVRQSALESERPYIKAPETPVMDKRVAEAMEFVSEVDAVNSANEINQIIDEYGALIDWCNAEKFIEGDCYKLIDTPQLGNPLFLDAKNIARIIKLIVDSPIVIEE